MDNQRFSKIYDVLARNPRAYPVAAGVWRMLQEQDSFKELDLEEKKAECIRWLVDNKLESI